MPDEITTTDTQGSSAEVKKPLLDQMKEFVKNETKSEEKPEESQQTSPEGDEKKEEDPDSEEKDESEEEKEPKKLNRYQRLKSKAEELSKKLEKESNDKNLAVKYANIYRQRYLALEEKLKAFQEKAKSAGIEESDVERENFSLKLREKERGLSEEFDKKSREEQAKQLIQERVSEMTNDYINQSLSLAQKYGFKGEEAKSAAQKVLKAYAFAKQSGEEVTLEEVADTIMQVSKNRTSASLERKQLDSNRSAPTPMRKGPSVTPTIKADKDGMKAYLASIGFKD